jgi:hypothetical protein
VIAHTLDDAFAVRNAYPRNRIPNMGERPPANHPEGCVAATRLNGSLQEVKMIDRTSGFWPVAPDAKRAAVDRRLSDPEAPSLTVGFGVTATR